MYNKTSKHFIPLYPQMLGGHYSIWCIHLSQSQIEQCFRLKCRTFQHSDVMADKDNTPVKLYVSKEDSLQSVSCQKSLFLEVFGTLGPAGELLNIVHCPYIFEQAVRLQVVLKVSENRHVMLQPLMSLHEEAFHEF